MQSTNPVFYIYSQSRNQTLFFQKQRGVNVAIDKSSVLKPKDLQQTVSVGNLDKSSDKKNKQTKKHI